MKERNSFSHEDIQAAKRVSILGYVESKGCKVARNYSGYALMSSPLREDRNPSFSIDKKENYWRDLATGEHGDVIELVRLLENFSFIEAMNFLLENSDYVPSQIYMLDNSKEMAKIKEGPKIHNVKDYIHNIALVSYLKSRAIPIELADLYLDEVYYYTQGKHYFALGFKNESGGYEIRNKYFKGSLGSKDVSLINGEQEPRNQVCVFEGFMDFLSLLAHHRLEKPRLNVLVLNSIGLINVGLNYIVMHDRSYLYLDNDKAGHQATLKIQAECQHECVDCSSFYGQKGFKDFNDYLINPKS